MAKTPRGGLHRLRVGILVTGILSLGVAGAPVAAEHTSAEHGVLVVDQDKVECPDAGYESIQDAVDAAASGSRIKVCPDLYTESVTIDKPLNLEAFRSRSQAERCHTKSTHDPEDTRHDVVVTSIDNEKPAFHLKATGVILEGFFIRDNVVGIQAWETSGYVIRRNLLQHNTTGVGPGGSADEVQSVVSHNCFRENTRTTPGTGGIGTVPGAGIANIAEPFNVLISHNDFLGNTFGMRFGKATNFTISHNTSLDDGTWLRMGGTQNLTVRHNRIGAGKFEGMLFIPRGGTGAPNDRALITHNVITGRGLDGFRAGHLVRTEPSLMALAMTNSVLSHNYMSNNTRDGIRIEAGGNTGNRLEHNDLTNNNEHDCHDDTAGSGTAGTANVWFENKALTENRVGLCTKGD